MVSSKANDEASELGGQHAEVMHNSSGKFTQSPFLCPLQLPGTRSQRLPPPHPLPRLLSSLLPFPGIAWHWQLPEKLGTDSIVTRYACRLHMPPGQGSPWECSSLFLSIKEVFSDGRGAEGSASSGVGVQQSREWGQLVFFMLGWALVQGRTSLGGEADRR